MSEETSKKYEDKLKNNKHHEGLAGKVFWGLLLILIGVLLLINNFGFIDIDWLNLFKLWPLFIIFAGLSALSFKNIIWNIVSVIFAIATVGLIGLIAIRGFDLVDTKNSDSNKIDTAIVKIESNEIKSAFIRIDSGVSDMRINTANQSNIVDATLDSDFATLSHKSEKDGTIQRVGLFMETGDNWLESLDNSWDVKVTRSMPISLDLNTGASKVDIDFSQAIVDSINIDMGASELVLTLSDNQIMAKVNINSGVSSIKIRVPKDSGVRLDIDDGLTSKKLLDLSKTEDGIYQSVDYQESGNKIEITAKIGVSSFAFERY